MDPGRTGVIRRSVAVRHQGHRARPAHQPGDFVPDLPRSDKGPKDLWAHQAAVLRDYLAHVDDADLAIELPTGAGKTLVGMLASQLQPAHPDGLIWPPSRPGPA
jgi:superfamily II DNA or RNA helicase